MFVKLKVIYSIGNNGFLDLSRYDIGLHEDALAFDIEPFKAADQRDRLPDHFQWRLIPADSDEGLPPLL